MDRVEARESLRSCRHHASIVLAFDVASSACSVAISRHGAVIAQHQEFRSSGQSERLVPLIETTMAEAALSYRELEAVAVTLGPGSFTGIRVGLATAKGLALAADLPVVGITNFVAVAAGVPEGERLGRRLAVLLESKRADFYVQFFTSDLDPLTSPAAIAPAALENAFPPTPVLLVGDAVERALPALDSRKHGICVSSAPGLPDAAVIAAVAASLPLPEPNAPSPQPLYLHPPSVRRPTG